MTRMFPIAVLLVATLFGAGGGLAVNRVVRALAALPEGAEAPAPNAGGDDAGPKAATPARPTVAARTSDREYLKTILCRNLFDSKLVGECEFDVKANAGPSEAITDLKVTLLGTLVAVPSTFSSALIVEEGEERAVGYSLNDKIRDAEIIAIESKLVRLRRGDGREEVLTMDGDEPPAPKPEAEDTEEKGDDEVRELGENHFEIDSETLDKYLSDLEGISRLGRALLHRGPDGEYDGYRLSAIRRNTIADKLGIRNGDIVHAVNGKPLDSMASAMEAFNTMRSEKNFSFEVTRRGKKETMTYDVK